MRLACRQITFLYPQTDFPLFSQLDCTIKGPGFHGLFGLSGVGKTTLARLLAGELPEQGGTIQRDTRGPVLYTSNQERLPGWSAVGDLVYRVVAADRHPHLRQVLVDFGLQPHLDSRFSRLSLGQKNRINLARYLLQDFDLLIMDESLANVDEAMRAQIILKIKALLPEKTFLYISHSVAEVTRFCDQVLVLRPASRKPQVRVCRGLDQHQGETIDTRALERAMLEIVHAA